MCTHIRSCCAMHHCSCIGRPWPRVVEVDEYSTVIDTPAERGLPASQPSGHRFDAQQQRPG